MLEQPKYLEIPKGENSQVRSISREVYFRPLNDYTQGTRGNLVVIESELMGDHKRRQKCPSAYRHSCGGSTSNRMQFADVKDATQQGKKKGDTYTWDVFQDVATRATQTIAETNTMPETNFTIVQGTLTIQEAGNSVPFSGKLDNLSKFPVQTIVNKVLKYDAAKWFDAAAHAQFNATPLRAAVATSTTSLTLTTNGTCLTTNSVAFRKMHANLMLDLLTERNIPPYTANDYYAIGWPTTFTQFRQDLELIEQYTSEGLQMIMSGEIGRYNSIRFVQQTNIPKGGAADSTTWNAFTNTADPWNNALSDWIFFCGSDTVAEAICVPEEMRGKIPCANDNRYSVAA